MPDKLGSWYKKQPAGIKLTITFLVYFLWFVLVDLITNAVLDEKPKRVGIQLLSAAIMAILLTLLLNWRNVKAAFRRETAE